MRKTRVLSAFALFCAAAPFSAFSAQSLDSTVERLAQDAARGYIGPVVSGVGTDLNSGWFHRAPPAKIFSPGFEVGVTAMFTSFGNAPQRFSSDGHFQFDRDQADTLVQPAMDALDRDPRSALLSQQQKDAIRDSLIAAVTRADISVRLSGATVVGDPKDSLRVTFKGDAVHVKVPPNGLFASGYDTTIAIPSDSLAIIAGGLLHDLPGLPLAAPQLTLGTVAGTNVTLRWLPSVTLNPKLGRFSYFGLGIQHNPAVWLPFKMPLDLSGGLFTQQLKIGRVFTAKTYALGLNASKTLGWRILNVTPYAGLMVEHSSMEVKYDYRLDLPTGPITRTVKFEAAGEDKGRVVAGLSLRLLLININADVNLGKYDALSLGLMVGI